MLNLNIRAKILDWQAAEYTSDKMGNSLKNAFNEISKH